MSKRAAASAASTADPCAVEAGQVFVTRSGRRVRVESVDWLTGAPRAVLRVVPCAHEVLRTLSPTGQCPRCPASPDPFESALTFRDGSWRMVADYQGPA